MTLGARFERIAEKARRMPLWLRRALPWFAIVFVLFWIFRPALGAHMARSANPHVFNDDARILIVPFYRYVDASLFPNDRVVDYYLESLPEGYRLLYIAAAKLWDPAAFSKLLPYLLLCALATALAMAANKLAGKAAAFGVLALCLGSEIFMARMAGGLPRSFTFPLIAGAAAALVYGNVWLLAALVVLGAAIYPVTAVIIGLSLGGMLLLLPANHRGQGASWSLGRRMGFLTATALAAALVLAPTALRLGSWGSQIKPSAFAQYPEAGPGGRFGSEDRPPFPAFFEAAPRIMEKTVVGGGEAWLSTGRALITSRKKNDSRRDWVLYGLFFVSLVGFVRLAFHRVEARRLLMLGAAALVGHSVARAITPNFFLPQRYVLYTVPILTLLMVTTCFAGLWARRSTRLGRFVFIPVLAGNLAVIALVGGRGGATTGLNVAVRSDELALYNEIAKLPKNAVLAGWPSSVDSIPYETKRSVLISFETSMPFHTRYTDMVRERTNAVIDAYFATSIEPLLRLRDEFGVTHMVVNVAHLRGQPLRYFKPFDLRIREAVARTVGKGYELDRQRRKAAIYERSGVALLDLSRLSN